MSKVVRSLLLSAADFVPWPNHHREPAAPARGPHDELSKVGAQTTNHNEAHLGGLRPLQAKRLLDA